MKNLRLHALAWGTTALCFLPLDAAWLTTMGPRLYQPALGTIMAQQPQWAAAAAFYALYILGMVVFTVRPGAGPEPRLHTAGRAAFFGLVAYSTYDLTNQATLSGWPWAITAIDLAWGATATTVATLASRALLRRVQRQV